MTRRIVVTRYGGPDSLTLREEPRTAPAPGRARIAVTAAGVARADLLTVAGRYPNGPRPPFTPGWDLVGVVEELGLETTGPNPGTRVAALTLGGSHASHIDVPAGSLVAIPDGVDPDLAACLPLNYLTATRLLRSAEIRPGDTILVHGASGGVGTALLDLARLIGVSAVGLAPTAALDTVAELGARPWDRAAAASLPVGAFDAVFTARSGGALAAARATVAPRGTLVSYGVDARRAPALVGLAQLIRIAWWSRLPGPRVVAHRTSRVSRDDPEGVHLDLARLFERLAAGDITPHLSARLPLAQAPDAYRLLDSPGHRGKVLLKP